MPGVPPTGRRLEIPTVVIVSFEDGKMKSEHLYWDQASALVATALLTSRAISRVTWIIISRIKLGIARYNY